MSAVDEDWREVGDRVFVRRHASLDLNCGLVVGDDACLVVDTRSSASQARDLAAAVRRVTTVPWVVVNTHDHFDHCYGNGTFATPGTRIWGHARGSFADEEQRGNVVAWLRESGAPSLADEVSGLELVAPDCLVTDREVVDVGGREVRLVHHGRGHTDHDVVVHVPDSSVTFAGDLVEEGNDPAMEDSFPAEWPVTLDAVLAEAGDVVVPGHGAVVDPAFVSRQRDDLRELVAAAAGLSPEADDAALRAAARGLPFSEPTCVTAFRRLLAR